MPLSGTANAAATEVDLEEADAPETEAVPLSELRELIETAVGRLGYSEDESDIITDVSASCCVS
jgi:hypothetical protein